MSAPPDIADLLAPYQGRGREALLPILWAVQTAQGHISAESVRQISHCIRVPRSGYLRRHQLLQPLLRATKRRDHRARLRRPELRAGR